MSQKKAYEQKMDAQIKEWQAKIDVLKAKAEKAGADQKVKYYENIESLKAKKKNVEEKLNQLKTSGENAWDELKEGVEKAWDDLKGAVESASKKFD